MRFFKRATQQSFVSYLNQYRVARAQTLLASTNLSIAQISEEVGFYDQSHFGMVFRKLVHTTPRQYRLQTPAYPPTALAASDPRRVTE